MKLLAFTDVHGNTEQLGDLRDKAQHVDIALCAGDISTYGDSLEQLIQTLASYPCPVYLIHGNHENPQEMRNLSLLHDGVTFLHKQLIDLETYHLVGYGGEGFSFTSDGFEAFVKNTPLPDQNIILLTHQPPHNTELDKKNGRHTGNNSFTTFIQAQPVVLSVAGHMHENFDVSDTISDAQVINPGPTGVILTL